MIVLLSWDFLLFFDKIYRSPLWKNKSLLVISLPPTLETLEAKMAVLFPSFRTIKTSKIISQICPWMKSLSNHHEIPIKPPWNHIKPPLSTTIFLGSMSLTLFLRWRWTAPVWLPKQCKSGQPRINGSYCYRIIQWVMAMLWDTYIHTYIRTYVRTYIHTWPI